MDFRRALFVGLRNALATIAVLFTLQFWYSSYLDVAVVHGDRSDVPMDAKVQAVRYEEHAKLATASLPIDKAMEAFAQRGHNASAKLAVKPSEDLSAMSGWIHRPGFKPYVPSRAAPPTAEATPPAGGLAAPGSERSAEQAH